MGAVGMCWQPPFCPVPPPPGCCQPPATPPMQELHVLQFAPLLGVRVGEKPDRSQQCALTARKANAVLSCNKAGGVSREGEVIVPLCSAPGRPHLQCCIRG